jgi:hypothetical protein
MRAHLTRRGRRRPGGRPASACLAACWEAGLAFLLAGLAGCGATVPVVHLPDKLAHLRLAGSATQRPSPRGPVIAAYEGYWQATDEALASHDPARARAIMAGYVPRHALGALVMGFKALWRHGEIGYGSPVFHIMSVKVTGSGTAAVHDCLDLSHAGFANQQTGQIVGGFGQSHDFMITTLAHQRGRWLVTGAMLVVQTCAY